MATSTLSHLVAAPSRALSFDRFAGVCAVAAGGAGLAYAIAFVILRNGLLSALCLMLGGLLTSAALVAVYERVRPLGGALALWVLLLAGAGALGATVHGGYDLANAIHPPTAAASDAASSIDPRGLLTFGLSGVGLVLNAWLLGRGRQVAAWLSYVAYASAALSVVLYLARLIVLTPTSPVILFPAVVNGFVLNPVWYVGLGLALLRRGEGGA
jgi:hypothetical protein